jgi:hypothetical protein
MHHSIVKHFERSRVDKVFNTINTKQGFRDFSYKGGLHGVQTKGICEYYAKELEACFFT